MGELAACLFEDAQIRQGPPNPQLLREARQWGRKGGRLGDASAMFFAGALAAFDGDREEGREWLIKAHQAGHDNALAFIREFGL